jgi:murein L,D-transpeptidase YcbB/YkuD
MTLVTFVNPRPPSPTRARPFKLAGTFAGLSLALTSLGLAGCHPNAGGFSRGDVDLALQTLKAAPDHGFAADRFQVARLDALLHDASPARRDEGARDLRAALIAYGRAQHGLTIPKSAFPEDWGLKPATYDAATSLDQAVRAGKLKAWLSAQPTPLPAYQALQTAYLSYLKIDAAGGWGTVVHTPLAPGASSPAVAALRTRLAMEDPALKGQPANAAADGELVAALQRFQAAHGVPSSGQLDAATLQELNVPALGRAAQIRANLERLRWLPRAEPATRVDVNIAAATMDYWVDGKLHTHMLAASGRPGGDETPMLASAIDGVTLNPPWNVPQEIAETEIIPKGEAYLQEKGFSMQEGRLVQKAGPDAALGLVKFEFDNPYAVYLHDTPAKAAFQRSQRAVSHGCVRLAHAIDFAKLLLSAQPGWSPEKVDAVLASGETTHVALAQKTPVRLQYQTAFVENGRIAFRPDIYGWDAKLLQMLDNPPAPRKPGKKA